VPIQDGAISLDSVLDPRNAADLESNRIIWRRNFYPGIETAGAPLVELVRFFANRGTIEIDVKSKRRWDRALWALIHVVSYDTIEEVNVRATRDIRAYMTAADGV